MHTPRALMVEDHPITREGMLSTLQQALPGWRLEAAASVATALRALSVGGPYELLVADHRLPDGDGLALLIEARRRWPTQVALLVSGSDDAQLAPRARAAGCMGFLSKSLEPGEWAQSVTRALAGEPQFPAEGPRSVTLRFTQRQLLVLNHIARGHSSRVIAQELGISERTVKDHLSVIFGRLDASTRAQAVARAMLLGLIDLAPGAAALRRPATS
jgi:DNA-binding NarL/FixJ family response regulator